MPDHQRPTTSSPSSPDGHRPGAARRSGLWIDLALIVFLAAAILIVRTQGWRGKRLNNPDMLPYYMGARALVQSGTVLDHGDISSYSSYSPPGTVYLMVPGLLFTSDARLQRVPGDALVFAGMILLLYLTLRPLLGRGIGLTAAALTAVSSVGYQGIYPVGHPVFVLGALAGLIAWVNGGGRWALPLALVSLAAGLYYPSFLSSQQRGSSSARKCGGRGLRPRA
jgi:hypothetical protein